MLRHWDAQPHVIAAAPNDSWDWQVELATAPEWREMLVAELDGRPIGLIDIIDPALEETHYWGDCGPGLRAIDIWIGEASDLGRGYGTLMMTLAIERCFSHPVRAILIDPLKSNVRAIRFYRRLGFRHVEDRWFDRDLCAVHVLERRTDPADAEGLVVRIADRAEVRAVQAGVLRPEGPLPRDRPPPPDAVHIGAFDGEGAVAAVRVLPAPAPAGLRMLGPTWQLSGMAVRADWRGIGVGRRVHDRAVRTAHERGAESLWAAARVESQAFYLGNGWSAVGPIWDKPGVGPHRHITLSRNGWPSS